MSRTRTCSAPGCRKKYFARGFCESHYRKWRRKQVPPCSVRDCGRPALRRGLCESHAANGGRPLRPLRAPKGRVLAWGRLYVEPSAVPVLSAASMRRRMSPSSLMADIIEAWCRTRASGVPAGKLQPCAFGSCEQPVYARKLCRTHYVQQRRGMQLRATKLEKGRGVAFGRLRFPPELLDKARAVAERDGISVADVIRRALESSLGIRR